MKVAKIREADATELAKQLADADEQMFRIGMQMRLGQLEGLKKYRVLRKDKARLLTIQRERELAKK
jgi:large subunit ribosomal protein L29